MQFLFADHTLDTDLRELRRGSEPIAVEPQVFDLLIYLVENRDRVVSKDDLIASVWGGRIVSDSTLSSRINAARKAIGDSGEGQRLIRTIARKGLRFVGAVRTQQNGAEPAPPSGTAPDDIHQQGRPALPLPDRPAIAVLPFTNMSGDPEQEYFSDGISEDIITDLSKIAGLTVIARNSSFTYKGRSVDVREIGRELGVRSVLEGSIRRAGQRVRITAQLIDAESGGHLWGDRYDRDLTDIFEVQDDVTHRIVDALKLTLSPAEKARLAESEPSNIDAYDCFLRGREIMLGKEKNRATFEEAISFLRKALTLDPNYSQAYACLAFAHIFDYQNRWSDDPDNSLQLAKQCAQQAVEKDANEPLAHCVTGLTALFERDVERAKTEVDLALSLSPNLALAHNLLGSIRMYSGQPLEAIPAIEQAMRLDPAFSHQFLHFLGTAYLFAGKYETAATLLKQRIMLVPETDFSRVALASALGHLGQADEAHRIWAELKEINPKYSFGEYIDRRPLRPEDAERIAGGLAKAGLLSS